MSLAGAPSKGKRKATLLVADGRGRTMAALEAAWAVRLLRAGAPASLPRIARPPLTPRASTLCSLASPTRALAFVDSASAQALLGTAASLVITECLRAAPSTLSYSADAKRPSRGGLSGAGDKQQT